MTYWFAICDSYFDWLRGAPLLSRIGVPGNSPEIVRSESRPVQVNTEFWEARLLETRSRALWHMDRHEIDSIRGLVASVVNDNLSRNALLLGPTVQFAFDGVVNNDELMLECVKRDLGWAAIELATGEPGFFLDLRNWYGQGRWPCGYVGEYPVGQVRVL